MGFHHGNSARILSIRAETPVKSVSFVTINRAAKAARFRFRSPPPYLRDLRQAQTTHERDTRGQGFYDLTREVRACIAGLGVRAGVLTLFAHHATASLLVQENADPHALADLGEFYARIAPEGSRYRHRTEGPDDMPGHIRAALLPTLLTIPVADGAPALGTRQAIYFVEHRHAPQTRSVLLHLIGS